MRVIHDKITIYALADPRDNSIRYVGASRWPNERYRAHLVDGRKGKRVPRTEWIAELLALELKPTFIPLERASEERWEKRERYHIKRLRKEGAPLFNVRRGGGKGWRPLENRVAVQATILHKTYNRLREIADKDDRPMHIIASFMVERGLNAYERDGRLHEPA